MCVGIACGIPCDAGGNPGIACAIPTLVSDTQSMAGGLSGSHLPHYRGNPMKELALLCLRGPLAALPGNFAQGNHLAQGGPTIGSHSLAAPKYNTKLGADMNGDPILFPLHKVSDECVELSSVFKGFQVCTQI